jgi:polyphosphate:AMP phosphotransferase
MKDDTAADPVEADTFESEATELRQALLDAQFDLAESRNRAILILLNGPDGSGKGEVLNRLYEWLDPRTIATLAYDLDDHHDARHPLAWRYWRDLPARGRIGVVLGSWYHLVLHARATRESKRADFVAQLAAIKRIEDMLDAEGSTLVKVWLDLSAGNAARRRKAKRIKMEAPGGPRHPLVREWAAIDTKKERHRLVEAADELVAATADSEAPWHRVPADDPRARDLAVGRLVLDALQRARRQRPPAAGKPQVRPRRISRSLSALATRDMSRAVDRSSYEPALAQAQMRLFELTQSEAFDGRALVCAFEGNDAAGKGGAIRRLRAALDPITSHVHPIAAPSDEELARPYLWRFWRRIPPRGHVAIFDRSWYGRVLVERVEGYAAPADWRRAYYEINDFERQLTESGYIVQKYWLAIDQDEQLSRFEARKETPHKRFKITADDWRNREKWPLYQAAVEDMIALTSTPDAPWTLVESTQKRFSRLKVLETLVDRLEQAL